MVAHLIYIRADLENITTLHIPQDHDWLLSFRDQNGDERRGVKVNATETQEIPSSRGSANLLLKFPSGNSPATISVTAVKGVDGKYTKSGEFQAVLAVESRGAEPFEWKPTGFYLAETEDGQKFDSVDLIDGDWCEFDEEAGVSVGVYNVETKVEVYRGK